jgi:hypothetical protein
MAFCLHRYGAVAYSSGNKPGTFSGAPGLGGGGSTGTSTFGCTRSHAHAVRASKMAAKARVEAVESMA